MKVLIDTNVLLDVLAKREPFYSAAAQILRLSENSELSAYITANSVTDIIYILSKYINNRDKLIESVQKLLSIISVTDVFQSDILKAFELDFRDYEDALIASCAQRIKARFIITRNIKDFTNSPIAPITPADFLSKFYSTTSS